MLDMPATDFDFGTAAEIAGAVGSGRTTAQSVSSRRRSPVFASAIRCSTRSPPSPSSGRCCAPKRSTQRARAARRSARLAGVPFAVKNLFDVAGLPTLAGSKINRDLPPATRDAALIERLEAAGAILVGALNMGEYAYDFTGENIHDGASRNPHDHERMTRRLLRRLGRGGRRRAGAARARLRHQRLDPRALLALRHFRAETDLRPADARADLSLCRQPRSSRAVRPFRARSRARLRRHAGIRCRGPGLRRPPA